MPYLILETGDVFEGESFGHDSPCRGEVVFQTGMVGYPEALTDPSYRDQILVLTYPMVGNYGVPSSEVDSHGILKFLESDRVQASALVVQDYSDVPSHWNSSKSLGAWLKEHKVPGLCGIDTRHLTKLIRERGVLKGVIQSSPVPPEHFQGVGTPITSIGNPEPQVYNESGHPHILSVDCGIKHSQIRRFVEFGAKVTVVSHRYDWTALDFDRLFVSNGPGDPEDAVELIANLQRFLQKDGRAESMPIFGICLGHQILSLAIGAKTFKMKFGNRGHNIPVQLIGTERGFITSQNHGYCVNSATLPDDWKPLFTNLNDNTNEGIYHTDRPWFSVQFHPEACAGPTDTVFLMQHFISGLSGVELIDRFSELEQDSPEYKKVLILGSGGLSIGQSGEFDYSGSQAIKAYNEENIKTVLINPNIATVQTSPGFADKVYFLPVTPDNIVKVIEQERPDCITASFGGQTALNSAVELYKAGVFEKYNIEVLGTPVDSVLATEDREEFTRRLATIDECCPPGRIGYSLDDAITHANELGYPVLVRAAFALGGLGSGFAKDQQELETLVLKALSYSNQITIDKSLKGWKEVEYEVVRDRYDNCICVCNMENFDPLGVHTGESIVVAPSQTLNDDEYNMLRETAIKTVRMLGIVGECNIQYALSPDSREYYIIEVNARLSRSSALASKATGYPLAYVAAKLSLGMNLTELKNSVTRDTTAFFEPSLDYCVVKVPRWDLRKFPLVTSVIDSAMKSIGESMGIARTFPEAFQKAIRMSNENTEGFQPGVVPYDPKILMDPQYTRVFSLATAFYEGKTVEDVYVMTKIDKWFLHKCWTIVALQRGIETDALGDPKLIRDAKSYGLTDRLIARAAKSTELIVRKYREKNGIVPITKQIDTVAGEFPCYTNYLYLTYNAGFNDSAGNNADPYVAVLGSGVYKIGSSVEFDWCCVNSIRELNNLGHKTIMINCNPETVSTDYDEADKLYFEQINFESVMDIISINNIAGVVISMGGQLPNNIAMRLHRQDVKVLGTCPEMIDNAENRFKFSRICDNMGIDQPRWIEATSIESAKQFCEEVSYPCLIRPSYVLSGAAMNIAYSDKDLVSYLANASAISSDYPVVISKFIDDAKEIEVDAVAQNGWVKMIAISEHVENAGVHSGDTTLILPPQDLTKRTTDRVRKIAYKIARRLEINGPFNIQFIAKDDQIKIIECNLRVSRSLPFVSKTCGFNFAREATKAIMGLELQDRRLTYDKVGVKVPMFSFHRLKNADVSLGVEMVSTGEVGCFGQNHIEAFYKAAVSAGYNFPEPGTGILITIGSYGFKKEFRDSVETLAKLGYKLYGTYGTADYYQSKGYPITPTDPRLYDDKKVQLVIDISKKNKVRSTESKKTHGYHIRRGAVDNNVTLLTDIKFAKLFVNTMEYYSTCEYTVNTNTDCISNYETVRLPGLVDVHVHIREPGNEYKGDWATETRAALAGGVTAVCCMPNTDPAITGPEELDLISELASQKAYCDYGLYVGANSENTGTVNQLADRTCALKMYLNNTYGPLLLENTGIWGEHIKNWNYSRPLCVHAEGTTLAAVLHLANLHNKPIHICHVSSREEIELIKLSKENGMQVTCEVAPHHLFLDRVQNTIPHGCHAVKPPLMQGDDRHALWENLDIIDCFATDHAPHTMCDKKEKGCPGYPGLETALPLLLTAVHEGKLTLEDIVARYHTNPKRIFGIPDQSDTYIEIDMNRRWIIPEHGETRCGWTPFAGTEVTGMVRRVVLRGKVVFVDGQVTGEQGYGLNFTELAPKKTTELVETLDMMELTRDSVRPTTALTLPRNIMSVEQLDRQLIRAIFNRTDEMMDAIKKDGVLDILSNKVIASIFYEPSTRTRCSFASAAMRLGAKLINVDAAVSSVQKGETLKDFLASVSCYSDLIVLRSSEKDWDLSGLKVPLINAGNGIGEHPTQALLDGYTIRQERGSLTGATVTMVGDLKYGRTAHSLAKLLCTYNVRLRYVSPPGLEMPEDVINYVAAHGIEQTCYDDLEDILPTTDVLYVTRVQKERFASEADYLAVKGSYTVTPELMSLAKDDMIVMHPLPRVDEISTDVDSDPRAAYFRQMENGLYLRAALIAMLFDV